jgi:alkylation response protein AidB-like acyl-CoA dehydrogenase
MDFALSEEHVLLRDSVRRLARDVIAPRAAEVDRNAEYPEDYFQAFKEADLLGLTLPGSPSRRSRSTTAALG